MSNREIVIDLLSKLPEDTSLEEIAREIELLAGIKTAREQTRRGEGIPAEEFKKERKSPYEPISRSYLPCSGCF